MQLGFAETPVKPIVVFTAKIKEDELDFSPLDVVSVGPTNEIQ